MQAAVVQRCRKIRHDWSAGGCMDGGIKNKKQNGFIPIMFLFAYLLPLATFKAHFTPTYCCCG